VFRELVCAKCFGVEEHADAVRLGIEFGGGEAGLLALGVAAEVRVVEMRMRLRGEVPARQKWGRQTADAGADDGTCQRSQTVYNNSHWLHIQVMHVGPYAPSNSDP
jgi:hypothetical protein